MLKHFSIFRCFSFFERLLKIVSRFTQPRFVQRKPCIFDMTFMRREDTTAWCATARAQRKPKNCVLKRDGQAASGRLLYIGTRLVEIGPIRGRRCSVRGKRERTIQRNYLHLERLESSSGAPLTIACHERYRARLLTKFMDCDCDQDNRFGGT